MLPYPKLGHIQNTIFGLTIKPVQSSSATEPLSDCSTIYWRTVRYISREGVLHAWNAWERSSERLETQPRESERKPVRRSLS